MANIAIVYWTGSGNTEAMANAIDEGAKAAGAETQLSFVTDVTADDIAAFDYIALGCPAMGSEQLEEYDFEPFYEELAGHLAGKKVALFGSYAWNDGQWMDDWAGRVAETGADIVADPVKAYAYPDDEALEACRQLGAALANA
ncbi:MAG: flavodoxin [Negativicoccus succinicivorans]|uniref:flavodoxin n=1 Tax=Negativicoccus succinicivorans TaxID=620903 RepID=UPI0026F2B86C|nr:flavodoxin [Negativicoccus succinicivorans]MBS6028531.1 flavodoxin [Negativicoccus succinicivorans]